MINWKIRFKNPLFWVQIGVALAAPILAYFGLTGTDMTTWSIIGETLLKAISNPYVCVCALVSVWNAVNDPTTKGASDSLRAMGYNEPSKQ